MTDIPGFKPVDIGGGAVSKISDAAHSNWVKRIAGTVNSILKGKLNVVAQVTLRSGQTTTTVIDARIGAFSSLELQPLTTHAAAAKYTAPYVLVTSQKDGQATLTHANDANVDKTFNLTILG